jgi:hypothetical protein
MQRFADSHTRLESAELIARQLIAEHAELSHLQQARVLFILSQREVMFRGFPAAAYIMGTRVQGAMSAFVEDLVAQFASPVFEGHDPDFIVRVDAATWDVLAHTEPAITFWRAAHFAAADTATWGIGQERLLFHELLHIYQRTDKDGALKFSDDDGRPVLALRPHDAEFFHDELERYGPTVCGAVDAAIAIAAGVRFENRRKLQIA